MSRMKGYHVKLVPQGITAAEERPEGQPEYIMEGDEPRLFATAGHAVEAGQEYTMDREELTFSLEPVVP